MWPLVHGNAIGVTVYSIFCKCSCGFRSKGSKRLGYEKQCMFVTLSIPIQSIAIPHTYHLWNFHVNFFLKICTKTQLAFACGSKKNLYCSFMFSSNVSANTFVQKLLYVIFCESSAACSFFLKTSAMFIFVMFQQSPLCKHPLMLYFTNTLLPAHFLENRCLFFFNVTLITFVQTTFDVLFWKSSAAGSFSEKQLPTHFPEKNGFSSSKTENISSYTPNMSPECKLHKDGLIFFSITVFFCDVVSCEALARAVIVICSISVPFVEAVKCRH